MSLTIDYDSVDFPAGGPVSNGYGTLKTSWNELLWSALTVGRPNTSYVFAYGDPSYYEALFRLSLIRMALEQSGPGGRRFRRTQAARMLDPTEKGAINYFLGLAVSKLFAARLLSVPWVLHLDVFATQLKKELASRSRPDLIGQDLNGDWLALECKGRISPPDGAAKLKAKEQAKRVTKVGGVAPTWNVGAVTYFRSDTLTFWWRDPPSGHPGRIMVDPYEEMWRFHYSQVLGLVVGDPESVGQMLNHEVRIRVEEADIEVGIHPVILPLLLHGKWDEARHEAVNNRFPEPYQRDGLAVVAGPSWLHRYQHVDGRRG